MREIKSKSKQIEKMIHTFRVEGMTCNHCKATVESGLKGLSGVSDVEADPSRDLVTVHSGSVSDENVKSIVERLGYRFGGRI